MHCVERSQADGASEVAVLVTSTTASIQQQQWNLLCSWNPGQGTSYVAAYVCLALCIKFIKFVQYNLTRHIVTCCRLCGVCFAATMRQFVESTLALGH